MMRPRRNPESGFAMLLVFAMAAMIAIGLYQMLPRAAFEAQREKESLLIDHGEQYKRGVQLYVRKMGRYPARIEDLDNTQNIRFLRKRYIDPLTGKDEWRLLHMGPAGKLIDSKIEAKDPNKDEWHAGSITEFHSAASSDGGPEAVSLATRHRPSDDKVMGPMGGPGGNVPSAGSQPAPLSLNGPPDPNSGSPGATGATGATGGPPLFNSGTMPGMPPGSRGAFGPTGAGPTGPTGQSSSVSGNGGFGSISGNGGYGASPQTPPAGGYPVNSQYQGQSPYPTTPGSNMPNNSGFNSGQNTNAANIINGLLTNPRPGGAPAGIGGTMPGMGGSMVGGLAGVATTVKGHGIKRYADQEEYQKWEFYYDFATELNANRGGSGSPAGQTGATGSTGNPYNGNSGFGGGNNGFGNSGSGFGGGPTGPTGGTGFNPMPFPPPPPR